MVNGEGGKQETPRKPAKRQFKYYEILGIGQSATTEEIRKAYRKLAKLYHPDVNSNSEASEKFKLINKAHQV